MRRRVVVAVIGLQALVARDAGAEPRFGAHDVPAVFVVRKSENRNEVRYGVRLDAACVPVGDAPVYAYWLDRDGARATIEDLGVVDERVYGIAGQWVTERGSAGSSKVLVRIRAAPDRAVAIVTTKSGGRCRAEAIAVVASRPAHLDEVFVHVAGFLSVDWIELRGRRASDGGAVVERVRH